MFTMPCPDLADIDTYDGIPLVELQDDTTDLRKFLSLLYDPFALPFKRLDPNFALSMIGPLKLAKKYQVDPLREKIVTHLENDWPTTLHDWDLVEAEIDRIFEENEDIRTLIPEPASAIRIACECDIPSVLPVAFYHLSRISPAADYDDESCPPGIQAARRSLLTHEDLEVLLRGTERIARWSDSNVPKPFLAGECREGERHIAHRSMSIAMVKDHRSRLDVLGTFSALVEFFRNNEGESLGFCSACQTFWAQEFDERRNEFFSLLGTFFV